MERLTHLYHKARALFSAKDRSSAGTNASPVRLLRQALPRYLSRDGRASAPLSLFIIINGRCNLACRICDVGQHVESSMFYRNMVHGDFEFDRFAQLMEEVQAFKPFISITSTEPLLYREIDDAVALIKGMGMEMNVTSNGVLLERHAEAFVKHGLDKITLSIDGPPDVHDTIRGVPGTYDRAMEGIRAVHALKEKLGTDKPRILVNTTICDLNAQHLERFFDGLPWHKIVRVGLMPMVFLTEKQAEEHNREFGDRYPATPTCLSGGVDLGAIDTDQVYEAVQRLRRRYGARLHLYYRNDPVYLRKFFGEPEVFLGGRSCLFPWFAAQISAQGDLLGLTRCYAATFGNVFENGFRAAWNGPKMREFRQELRRRGCFPACSRCEGVLAN